MCWCLEGGISNHIATNELLRSEKWFGLGAIVPAQDWFDFKTESLVRYALRRLIIQLKTNSKTSLDKPNKTDKLEYRVQQKYVTKSRDAIIKQNRRHAQDDHYYD